MIEYCTLKWNNCSLFHHCFINRNNIHHIVFSLLKWSFRVSMTVQINSFLAQFTWNVNSLTNKQSDMKIHIEVKLNFLTNGRKIYKNKNIQLYPQVPAVEASLKVTIIRGDWRPPVCLRLEEKQTVRNKETTNHVQRWRALWGIRSYLPMCWTKETVKSARHGQRLRNLNLQMLNLW